MSARCAAETCNRTVGSVILGPCPRCDPEGWCTATAPVFDHLGCPQDAQVQCTLPPGHDGGHSTPGGHWPNEDEQCTRGPLPCPRCDPLYPKIPEVKKGGREFLSRVLHW